MDQTTKERWAKQRAAAARQAQAGGVDDRRDYLRMTLRALDDAIEKSPDDVALRAQRAEVAGELRRLGTPSERERLSERLADVESRLENGSTLPASEKLLLLAEYNQLSDDLRRFNT